MTTYPRLAWAGRFAWLVILGLVAFTTWSQATEGEKIRRAGDELGTVLQGRVVLGTYALTGDKEKALAELEKLKTGPYRSRLLVAVLVAEIDDRAAAREYLAELEELRQEHDRPLAESDERLRDLLARLYGERPADELTEEERALLGRFGWLGRLAVAHRAGADPDEAKQVRAEALRGLVVATGMLLAWLALAVVGLILLGFFLSYWAAGQVDWAFAPRPAQSGPDSSGLYAESFAVWMAAYLALSRLVGYVPGMSPLAGGALAMLLSGGLALGLARLRGRDWPSVREDVGLHAGRGLGREVLAGLATYAVMVPLFVAATVLVVALTGLAERGPAGADDPFAPSARPSHPLARLVFGDVWVVVSIYLTAAVVAPVVEELVFRGMLQRQVRGWLGRLPAALVVALPFAIIHPQGLLGVPVLLAIAVPLSLAREWRGSLVAPMVAHAVNNAAATTLILAMVR